MSTITSGGWRAFWMPFAAGWALFVFMVATNGRLVTAAAPRGILDHQAAGTGARVDEIQSAWAAVGTLGFARLSIGLDLVFIGLITLGALIACAMIVRRAPAPALRVFAGMTGLVWLGYGATDYVETFCEFVQVSCAGSDPLAGLAASMGLFKMVAFLIGHLDLLIAFVWFRAARAKTATPV